MYFEYFSPIGQACAKWTTEIVSWLV